MQGMHVPQNYIAVSLDPHEVHMMDSPLASPTPWNASPASPPYMQHSPALPGVSLNQLLQTYLEQQQQAMNTAALAAYVMSLQQCPASTAAPMQPAWALDPPGLCNDGCTAWRYQPATQNTTIFSNQEQQLAGTNAVPCAAAAAAYPHPTDMWAVQHSNSNCSQGTSDALANEVQLQCLLNNCQINCDSLYNTYSAPLSTSSASSFVTVAAAPQSPAAAAAAPASFELSLAKLGLRDASSTYSSNSSSSSSIGSPSRTSSFNQNGSLSSSSSWCGTTLSNAIAAAAASVSSCSDSQDEDDLPIVHNHFCRQEISLALNATVTVLLNTLRGMQYAGENPYPKLQRLYVCGLRESCKAIKAGKAKAILLAPDIQVSKFGKQDRALDSRMNDIILSSQLPRPGCVRVPVVFALSRKKIGQVFGSKKRMSAIALLDVTGVEELFALVLQLGAEGRQRWEEMQAGQWMR